MLLGLNRDKPKLKYPQTLAYSKGCPVVLNCRNFSKDAGEMLHVQNDPLNKERLAELTYGIKKPAIPSFTPSFVKLDNKVLCFDGVIFETMEDIDTEKERVRFVKVYYYLENDTMRVIEPEIPNSGLHQGTLLRRDYYPYPNGMRYYIWKDLNIGKDIFLHSYRIHLFDCEKWTREYLTAAGIDVNDAEPKPKDPYLQIKESRTHRNKIRKSNEEDSKLKFLKNHGKVLRFYGVSKNDQRELTNVIQVLLKFYLEDDTIEVFEIAPPNSGRNIFPRTKLGVDVRTCSCKDSFMTLIGRQKVLVDRKKDTDKIPCYFQPHEADDMTWMTAQHFKTGEDVTILGKTFFLSKCDAFTTRHYEEHFGISLPQMEIMQNPKISAPMLIPPHGLGNYYETLQDCFTPTTRPPKRVTRPFLRKSEEFTNTVLRFLAIMDTPCKEDHIRKFVLSFFLEDDTVKINEESIKNSGFGGGTFLKRCRLRKDLGPTMDTTPSLALGAEPIFYEVQDFHIGATIKASGSKFLLKDADLAVFNFMENHPEIYKDLCVKKQVELALKLSGKELISSHEQRTELLSQLRNAVLSNYGPHPFPPTKDLDLGSGLMNRRILEERLFSANIPIPLELIRKLLDCFTFTGKTDVEQVLAIIIVALGHDSKHLQ